MKWGLLWMVIYLLPAMNVVFQPADLAMSMKEEKEANSVLSVKLDISDSKVKHRTMDYAITSFNFSFFLNSLFVYCEGSPRVEGDDDEEDIDDIEHEFNIDDERNKHSHIAEAMLHGKMSYGRGPDDNENAQYGRTQPVSGQHFYSLASVWKFFPS